MYQKVYIYIYVQTKMILQGYIEIFITENVTQIKFQLVKSMTHSYAKKKTRREKHIRLPDFPTPPSPRMTILYTRNPPRVVFDGCTIFDRSPLFSFLLVLSSFLFLLFFRGPHPMDSPVIVNKQKSSS